MAREIASPTRLANPMTVAATDRRMREVRSNMVASSLPPGASGRSVT